MSPFPLPVLFTAWVWKDGAGIAGEVIRRAKLGGFKTVAVQLSQDTGGDPGATLDAQDVRYLKEAGLFVVGWDPANTDHALQCHDLGLDGWLPQVEGPGQRDALLAVLRAGYAPKLPRALVTTYGGLDTTADVAALKAAWGSDPFVFVECYKADGPPHDDIPRMLAQGGVYGFSADHLRALAGTYRGEGTADYPGLNAGNYGGIYLEEQTTDDQLRAFAALAIPTPEKPTVTNDAAARNAQVASITKAWLDNFGPRPLTRMACEHDIAVSDDEHWGLVAQDVRDALNGTAAGVRAELLDVRQKLASAVAAQADLQSKLNAAQADLALLDGKIAAAQKDLA